jgi:hypothetical protein
MTTEEFIALAPDCFAARLTDDLCVSRGVAAVAAAVFDAVSWIERLAVPYFNHLVMSGESGR